MATVLSPSNSTFNNSRYEATWKFLFCTRDRGEATASLAKAQNIRVSVAQNLYDRTHEVLEEYAPGKNLILVDHHDLLHDNAGTMKKIATFCSLDYRDTSHLVDMQLYPLARRR